MRAVLLATWLVFAGAALAAGYDDFARGVADNEHEDSVSAVANFSAAIAQADLSPSLLPQAYRGRALAYLRLNRCRLALTDLDTALKLKPDDMDALAYHVDARICLRDLPAAETELTTMVAKYPVSEVFDQRANLRWRMRDFAGAAADFAQTQRLLPTSAYAFLWLQAARLHAGTFDAKQAQIDADHVSTRSWPGALVSYYLGDASADEVDRAAADPGREPVELQQCEADFFVGEWALGHNDLETATARLKQAAVQCPPHQAERIAAIADLERNL